MTANAAVADKTCKVTLVANGISDRVLKVFPAEHEAEKIWLDNARGVARWAEVERLMFNFAPRGVHIPKPVAYHQSVKNLVVPDITEADIPVVKLEGAFLTAPIVDDAGSEISAKLEAERKEQVSTAKRLDNLEANMAQILALLQPKAAEKSEPEAPARKPGRPRKED